jgi:hypothetical protein
MASDASNRKPVFPKLPANRTYRRHGPTTPMTDAVEKVPGMPPARNKRIMGAEFLNLSCAFDARLESMLLGDLPKNPFSTWGNSGIEPYLGYGNQLSRKHSGHR